MFYWAKMYTADFKAGESYDKLHRCIAINIIADGFRLNDAIHSEYLLQEKTAHTVLTDVLEVNFWTCKQVQKLTSLSIFEREFLLTQKRRHCVESPPSVAVLKTLLKIGGADTRHEQKLPAGVLLHVED